MGGRAGYSKPVRSKGNYRKELVDSTE